MNEVQANIETWNYGYAAAAFMMNLIIFLVWLGGRMAFSWLNK